MALTRTHVPWSAPFLPALAKHLTRAALASARRPWDLRDLLVVVPTRQAGRRLREALAARAAAHGTGVLAPLTLTPEALVRPALGPRAATPLDALAAWTHVLARADLDACRAVFPLDPPVRDTVWALGVARELHRVQSVLADHNLSFGEVAARVAASPHEPERWAQLAALEAAWREQLARRDLADPLAATRAALELAPPPPGVRRVVVAGVLDLLAPARRVLARWAGSAAPIPSPAPAESFSESADLFSAPAPSSPTARPLSPSLTVEVEIVIHGDAADALHDDWGRPLAEPLLARHLPLDPAHATLLPVRDTAALAERVAALARAYAQADAPATLALGLADPAAIPAVSLALERVQLAAFDPAGRPLAATGVGRVAAHLADLVANDTLEPVVALLRAPLFAQYAVHATAWAPDHATLLFAYDELHAAHLPTDLESLLAFARADLAEPGLLSPRRAGALAALVPALDHLLELRAALRAGPFAATLLNVLARWTEHRRVDLADSGDAAFAESAQALRDLLVAHAALEARHPDADPALWPLLLRAALDSTQLFPDRPADAVELHGWLELAYLAAPHLVLAGANEGRLPENIRPDAFLPEPLRRHLGLPTPDDRYARDFLLLEGLLRSRAAAGGRVDVLVPRLGADGDPLQPSRLLFACADAELVPRALTLFADLPPPPAAPPRRRAWKLGALPPPRDPDKFSPSRLRAYLACPYHYYLEHALGMEAVDPAKSDLDPFDFGNLCHLALEALGREESLRNTTDAEALTGFLHARLDLVATRRWGATPPLPVAVQISAARARLAAFAAREVAERAAGWRTLHVEREWTFARDGVVFHGRIDRIDTHPEHGLRVLDYKTSEKASHPAETHLARHPRPLPHVLPAAELAVNGKPHRWIDLQLPLYLLALRHEFPGQSLAAGYVCLPKTQADIAFALWEGLAAPELLASAEACALAAAEAIRSHRFWPPNPALRPAQLRAFAPLFPDGRDLDVDAAAVAALARPPEPFA